MSGRKLPQKVSLSMKAALLTAISAMADQIAPGCTSASAAVANEQITAVPKR